MKTKYVEDDEFIFIGNIEDLEAEEKYVFDASLFEKVETMYFLDYQKKISIEWIKNSQFPNLSEVAFGSNKERSNFILESIKLFGENAVGITRPIRFRFESTKIDEIPKFIFDLPHVEKLEFRSEPNITKWQSELFNLDKLKKLSFEYNSGLNNVPDEIRKLKNLEAFNLWGKTVEYVSKELYNLPRIKTIGFAYSHYQPILKVIKELEMLSSADKKFAMSWSDDYSRIIELQEKMKTLLDRQVQQGNPVRKTIWKKLFNK